MCQNKLLMVKFKLFICLIQLIWYIYHFIHFIWIFVYNNCHSFNLNSFKMDQNIKYVIVFNMNIVIKWCY